MNCHMTVRENHSISSSLVSPLYYKVSMATAHFHQVRLLFLYFSTYSLFVEESMHISCCWDLFMYFFNTTCMYKMYILNVS